MTSPRLSICIPVYNFARFLGATLETILRQAPRDLVEIDVVDGASTDGTPEVVRAFQERHPNVRYHRLDRKGGIDRDIAKGVELSRGEYCWLFSGDDLMRDGAIAALLGSLDDDCDVFLMDAMLCDVAMRPLQPHRMLAQDAPRTFRLHERADRLEYFRLARNTAAFFSFCSVLAIKRARWIATSVEESYYGTCWAHAARLFTMLPGGLTVGYLPHAALDKRGGNDSFLTHGLTRRFAIAVDGYGRIADEFFGHHSEEALHVRRSLRLELPWAAWIAARVELEKTRSEDRPLYERLVRKQYSDWSFENWATRTLCLTPAYRAANLVKIALERYQHVVYGRG
jgi:abequosyltransferase